MQITEEMKQDYLKHKGLRCLFCQAKDSIVSQDDEPDFDDDYARCYIRVECAVCKRSWIDVYQLLGVAKDLEEAREIDDQEDTHE